MENLINIELFLNRKIFKKLDKSLVTERHKQEIYKILNFYKKENKCIRNRLKTIYDFIQYDVEGDWLERINIILTVLKNDSQTDYALEIRYGKKNIEKMRLKSKSRGHTLDGYIKKYGDIDGPIKYKEFREKSKCPWGLSFCVEKYGEIEGKLKWEEKLAKKIKTQNERKAIKPYRNGQTLEEYQNRYGDKEGYDLYHKKNSKISYRFSENYYIENYGEIDGKLRWEKYKDQMDKTSLNSFIKRYGKKEGKKKFKVFGELMSSRHSEEYYIDKYGDEGRTKWAERILNMGKNVTAFKQTYSQISQKLFWSIYDKMDEFNKEKMHFAELNEEFYFYPNTEYKKIFYVDFKLDNKIIEFDGDYWHSLDSVKIRDKFVDEYLQSVDHKILRIKECDYNQDNEKIVNQCIKFLINN